MYMIRLSVRKFYLHLFDINGRNFKNFTVYSSGKPKLCFLSYLTSEKIKRNAGE